MRPLVATISLSLLLQSLPALAGTTGGKIDVAGERKAALSKQAEFKKRPYSTEAFVQALWHSRSKKMAFKPGKRGQDQWFRDFRKYLRNVLGIANIKSNNLAPRVSEKERLQITGPDGRAVFYHKEKVSFETREGLRAFGYFLLPEKLEGKKQNPCVICLHGHPVRGENGGVNQVLAVGAGGKSRPAWTGYQRDFPLKFVLHGFPVFAIEQMGTGERLPFVHSKVESTSHGCSLLGRNALMLGESLMGWRVYDVIRTVDYLQSRPEIDGHRIGLSGMSMGGAVALYAAAVEPRIKAVAIASGVNDFYSSLGSYAQCLCNYVPGIAASCDVGDILASIAPRAVILEQGRDDDGMPIAEVLRETERARKAFKDSGHSGNFAVDILNGPHDFSGRRFFSFMRTHLNDHHSEMASSSSRTRM